MIHPYDWFKNIQTVLKEFADAEFQERVWVRGEGEEVSDWTEAMCKLFDDYQFDDFLDESWPKLGLSDRLHAALDNLRSQLNHYEEKETSAAIAKDPKWQKIRDLAQDILAQINLEMQAKSY
jgi:hypothetical protein